MIVLFTDFGLVSPYTGQMKSVLCRQAPGVPIIDLFADAPAFHVQLSAYLLAAYIHEFPAGTVFLCVVDPGVGSDRMACVVRANDRWFVGPANGLFELVMRRASRPVECWRIDWRPARLSASFHGRDLFAPVAAALARGDSPPGASVAEAVLRHPAWPDDLPTIVYVDGYGNAMTGLRAARVAPSAVISIGPLRLGRARTFSDVPIGAAFWYENSNGLVEIAVNQGRAADLAGIAVGSKVSVEDGVPPVTGDERALAPR